MLEAAQRDRSPAFPVIPLGEALKRLEEFENHFKRIAARSEKVGEAWGVNKGYADRIAAGLRYFGLLDYQGQGAERTITVSDMGRKYLRAQQDEVKREIVREAALRPKQIAKFWDKWGRDRPTDAACLDELTLNNGFSAGGARDFLKVYDATISFARLGESDKIPDSEDATEADRIDDGEQDLLQSPPAKPRMAIPLAAEKVPLMEGERELTTGLLSKGASFRLIVSGKVGEKEIERLIRKLELDKEILAETEG
ncbi:MAG TPA: hypothetical protein VFA03_14435 [Acetobacteraceae bacterium]|nr:hypothetical protein [Acetobacteraceae bacterium]